MLNFTIVIFMTIFGALGGLFLKKATKYGIGLQPVFLVNLLIGGILYVLGAILNILLLKYIPYHVVYPLTSITYVWTLIFSYFLLSEKIGYKKNYRSISNYYRSNSY